MRFSAVAAVLVASIVASTIAAPANYYQQPSFYYQSRSSPQRLMYMQYVQQPSVSRQNGRLTNAAAAFVAGDSVATGTYVKDDTSAEQQIAAESVLDNTGANGAQSVAEAYPDPQEDDVLDYAAPQAAEPEVPEVPEQLEDDQTLEGEPEPVAEEEAVLDANPEPVVAAAAAPAVPELSEPAAAAVELEEEAINDDEDETSDDDYVPPTGARRRPVSPKDTSGASQPAGSFFSVDFGGANGGAVAISNSYSTGTKGSARSQAVAFGKPEESDLRNAPSYRRH